MMSSTLTHVTHAQQNLSWRTLTTHFRHDLIALLGGEDNTSRMNLLELFSCSKLGFRGPRQDLSSRRRVSLQDWHIFGIHHEFSGGEVPVRSERGCLAELRSKGDSVACSVFVAA